MLSVIVPIYNTEKYLCKCVESILKQTYTDLEIILVNDCSTDSSGAICDELGKKDDRIKVIHFDKNSGLIAARYAGVQKATSNYVAFVDSDDWLDIHMYENLMKIMLEYDVDLVSSGVIEYWDEDDYKKKADKCLRGGIYNRTQIESEIIPIMLWNEEIEIWGVNPSLCLKIFRRKYLLEHYQYLINYSYYYAEDTVVTYPYILITNSIYITYDCYYYYRVRARGQIAPYIKSEDFYENALCMYESLRTIFLKNEKFSDVLMKQLNLFYIYSVNLRKRLYSNKSNSSKYLFPFDKIEKDSTVILYGAGIVGNAYYAQIKKINYCKILKWVDKNYKKYDSELISSIEGIENLECDYIVIANTSKDASDMIRHQLCDKGIMYDKIIYS